MATRALKRSRTFYAALLLVGVLAAPLVAWFFSGWADVRAQQRELYDKPKHAAEQRAAALIAELRSDLTRLLVRESQRPYFYYQNLYHDPRTGPGNSVATSPLASGPQEPLVLGYFNVDVDGRLTTPTINDQAPHLSEPTRLAENQRFRDEASRSFAALLETKHGELVASASQPTKRTITRYVPIPQSEGVQEVQQQTQVVQLDPDSYAQNKNSNEVYWSNFNNSSRNVPRNNITPQQESIAAQQQAAKPPPPKTPPKEPPPKQRYREEKVTVDVPATPETKPVTITISPFEWRTFPFASTPSLVAVRQVETPDGTIAQGFVVDRSTLTTWLASRADDLVAQLVMREDGGPSEIAPGWHLDVTPNPRTFAASAATAAKVASSFLMRFIAIGVIAALAAMLVVMLVARAEKLARERSQFAAAAAHELRTPLAGLQLYGDMLADGLGDPAKLRDYARRMSEEASRLGRVVSNVLGFSQLERGNLSVDVKPGPLGEVLKELVESAEPALDRAGAMLALEVSPDLRARYDRDAVIRVIGNLLDNAEKYGRAADDRTIDLVARETADAVEIVVSDHGPGVAPEARTKLFRVFSRGVDADGPAGLGLGLALSKSLAQAMGGDLEYRPSDAGATFVLKLQRES